MKKRDDETTEIRLDDLEVEGEVKGGGSLIILSDDVDEIESSSRIYTSSGNQ